MVSCLLKESTWSTMSCCFCDHMSVLFLLILFIVIGDIKCENVLVTSWNWLYLADFASFKPTYIPYDDPSDFSFFFDTGGRRLCYLAPEVGSYSFMFILIRCCFAPQNAICWLIFDLETMIHVQSLVIPNEPSSMIVICCGLATLYGFIVMSLFILIFCCLIKLRWYYFWVYGFLWRKRVKEIKETTILIKIKKKRTWMREVRMR